MQSNRRDNKNLPTTGFTLMELLVVVAITALLLGVAIPNMQSFFIGNRLVSGANDFVAALNTARSEAIRRRGSVSLRKSSATSGDWGSAGWTMFVDSDADGTLDAGETTLKVGEALPSPLTLYANNNFVNFIRFTATGESNNIGTFVFCHGGVLQQGGETRSRAVIVAGTGRVRVAVDSDGDGIPNTDSGNVASCTNP